MRSVAFELLRRIKQDDAYANLLLPKLLRDEGVDSRDAGFIQELAFGTLRNRLLYERIIEKVANRAASSIDSNALIVLLLGTHQLLGMRVPGHAAINETVNLAKTTVPKSAVGFINAVLRGVSAKTRQQWIGLMLQGVQSNDERMSLEHSHPLWIVRALRTALEARGIGESLEQLLIADNEVAKVAVAALPGFSTVAELLQHGQAGLASPICVELSEPPAKVPLIRQGFARVQDQGSQLAVLALTNANLAIPDSSWIDVCAGPGGKAALMAALAKEEGLTFQANELSSHRAKLVRDAVAPLSEATVSEFDGRDIGFSGPKFSRILLDAPCTGLGALRRRPEARWRKSSADLADLSKLQRELFAGSWDALLPGGVLAYVTCSPHVQETTALVSWVESKWGNEVELLSANAILNEINPLLGLDESFRTTQLWPHVNGTDAMFIALFRKKVNF